MSFRLQKTWQTIPKEKIELFDELARIFSEDNNQWTQRELLMKEGTAKFAGTVSTSLLVLLMSLNCWNVTDTVGENDKQLQKIFQRQNHHTANISFGTIPYLGTFLTDLTMIDTAIPDMIGDGLINFDKRRKEFEVLAQIKLLQVSFNYFSFTSKGWCVSFVGCRQRLSFLRRFSVWQVVRFDFSVGRSRGLPAQLSNWTAYQWTKP